MRTARLGLLVIALLTAASCAPSTTGTTGTTPATSSTQTGRSLDASAYNSKDKICDVLPDADAVRLGYLDHGDWQPEGHRRYDGPDHPFTIGCSRYDKAVAVNLYIDLYLSTDVVGPEYQSDQDYGVVDTVKVRGQTGVVRRIADRPQVKFCEVDVSLSDKSGLVVEVDGMESAKGCASAKAVAEAVVDNLSA